MKRKVLLSLALLLALCLCACGAGGGDSSASGGAAVPSAVPSAPAQGEAVYDDMSMSMESQEAPMEAGSAIYEGEDAKIIRTASLYLQTTEFDAAVQALDRLVDEHGGYYEKATTESGGYYSSSASRSGYYTIRVPKEQFSDFLSSVGDVGHIVSRTVDADDVGEAYYDAELRLATLETKHERLLALLEQAEIMEDIISLESALSDVEYEIQQYTSTLDRYDALIDFSTITLELQEVARVTESPSETDSLGTRVARGFSQGWTNFCDGMGDLAVWIAYHFVGCLIFAVAVILAAVLIPRRIRRRRNGRSCPGNPNP